MSTTTNTLFATAPEASKPALEKIQKPDSARLWLARG